MKNFIFLLKQSLFLVIGPALDRKRTGNGSAKLYTVLWIFLMLFSLGTECAWASDSGLSASSGTFILDFYDSENLTATTSSTNLSLETCTTHVKVPTGIAASSVVTAVAKTGTVQLSKNGGLTFGGSSTGYSFAKLTIGSDFPVRKITVKATEYDSSVPLWVNSTSVSSLNTKSAAYANCTTSVHIACNFVTQIRFGNTQNDDSGTKKKRVTLYTAICEYGYRAYLPAPSEGSISAVPKTANENGAGWNSDTLAVMGLKSGQKVTLSATPPSGKVFDSWTVKKKSDNTDITATVLDGNDLTMPAYDVKVSVTWRSAGCSNYSFLLVNIPFLSPSALL